MLLRRGGGCGFENLIKNLRIKPCKEKQVIAVRCCVPFSPLSSYLDIGFIYILVIETNVPY